MIKLKRVYLDAEKEDGYRILVDRFWPRGISKEKAQLDLWLKEIAPSNEEIPARIDFRRRKEASYF